MVVLSNWRIYVFGLLSWLIPFAISIPFFSPETGLLVPLELFKSIMVVTGAFSGTLLLVLLFRQSTPSVGVALLVGILWMFMNWVLDYFILIPMSGTNITTYAMDIGLRYFSIPIIACGMAMVARSR